MTDTIDGMESLAFAAPLLLGQTGTSQGALAACRDGARKEAYRDARRRAGITREGLWIHPAGDDALAVVYLEADDLAAAFTILRTSAEPFDRWFRDHLGPVYDVAWGERSQWPEPALDLDIDRI